MAKTIAELLGHPPPPKTGRDRLIWAGIELFYRRGFGAVGIDLVMEHAGVTKTTFYKHFESKEDFVLVCVQTRDAWEGDAWDRAARRLGGDESRARLIGFLDALDEWFNLPDFRGCMFINAAAEFSDPRDPIHQAAAAHKRKARDYFRDLAAQAGAADADTFADQFTILIEGTLVLRHAHDRDDAARVVRPTVVDLIDRHLPKRAAAGARR